MAVPVADWANATTGVLTPGQPISLAKPTGVSSGDLLIIFVGNDSQTATAQWDGTTYLPTGFTFWLTGGDTASDAAVAVFTRVADGTEGATFSVPAQSSVDFWAICVRVSHASGFDGTHMNVLAASVDLLASASSHPLTAVTSTKADGLGFGVLSFDGGDGPTFTTSSTGWTIRQEIQSGTGAANASGCVADKDMATAGSTGTLTIASALADGSAGFQFVITPAGGTVYNENLAITATATVTVSEKQDYVEALSIAAAATLTLVEAIAYVEALTVTGTITTTVVDTQDYVDALAISAAATLSLVDTQDYVEALTVAGTITTVLADTQDYVEDLAVSATMSLVLVDTMPTFIYDAGATSTPDQEGETSRSGSGGTTTAASGAGTTSTTPGSGTTTT